MYSSVHRMYSSMVLSVGHLWFGSTQSLVHNHCSYVHVMKEKKDFKLKNMQQVRLWNTSYCTAELTKTRVCLSEMEEQSNYFTTKCGERWKGEIILDKATYNCITGHFKLWEVFDHIKKLFKCLWNEVFWYDVGFSGLQIQSACILSSSNSSYSVKTYYSTVCW